MANAPTYLGSEWVCAVALGVIFGVGGGCFAPALPQAEVDGDDADTAEVSADIDDVTDTADGADTSAVDATETADTADSDASEVDARPTRPGNVTASTSRVDSVEVRWDAVSGADGYRVERCALPCDDAWSEVAASVGGTSYVDEAVAVPTIPEPPGDLAATASLADRVDLSWSAVVAEPAQRYWYRVTAIGSGGEAEASEPAEGSVAERPVTGYEVLVGANWVGAGSNAWSDDAAPAPSLVAGTASASQATSTTHVALSVSGSTARPGAPREYAVRVVTSYGWSAPSASVTGLRLAGELTFQWEKSAGASADEFVPISGATATTFNDTDAPADGSTRWYRVVVSAEGAEAVTTEPVAGARQGAPEVPGAVQASSDRVDRVEVSWQAVSGAIGYHVYRDGTKLTTGNGVAVTSYSDLTAPAPAQAWSAPSAVAATTNDFDKVIVSWVAPTRPEGAAVAYTVAAVSAAGEGPASGDAIGRRVGVALVGYDVEVTPSGGNATWVSTGTTETAWDHVTAPAGVITPGTITASLGTRRAGVALSSTGASVAQPLSVTYRVRGALADATTTATSGSTTGRRTVGSLQRRWQRMSTPPTFEDLPGTATAHDDTTAPSNGEDRTYRLALSANGSPTVYTPAVQGARLAFTRVAVGGRHTCAFSARGEVWCWGANDFGQLGRGTTSANGGAAKVLMPNLNEPVELALGTNHTCVTDEEGNVQCWGKNTSGQLGDGTTISKSLPGLVLLNNAANPFRIAAGAEHSCVIDYERQVWCWGANDDNQLGNGGNAFHSSPVAPSLPSNARQAGSDLIVASVKGTCTAAGQEGWYCWGVGGHGLDPVATTDGVYASPLLGGVVTLGADHGCLSSTSTPKCWSNNNSFGQVGNGSLEQFAFAEPTPVVRLVSASDIEVTTNSSFAAEAGVLYVWGDGSGGLVGDGLNIPDRKEPIPVPGPAFAPPWELARGGPAANHMCALVDYAPRCWGANGARQLGTTDANNRFAPVAVAIP